MNKEMKSSMIYLTWQAIWRMRCCPPDSVLFGEQTPELQQHLEFCPHCREEVKQAAGQTGIPPFQGRKDSTQIISLKAGQLWSLKQELGGWGPKRRYYAPPLVVLTDVHDDSVTVYQSCGDMIFAAADDIPFQNNLKGFIQPWNHYSLLKADLDSYYGDVVEDPSRMSNQHDTAEPVIEPGSLLWFFRQMEVETGYFFSSRAVSLLLREHESKKKSGRIHAINPETLRRQLCDMGAFFPEMVSHCETVRDILLHVQLPDNALPLAASDDITTEYALCLSIQNGKAENIKHSAITISQWHRNEGYLHVVGKFHENMPSDTQIYVRLNAGGSFFEPVPGEFGVKNKLFWALFDVGSADTTEGECIVRVIYGS